MWDPTIICALIGAGTTIIATTAGLCLRMASQDRKRHEREVKDERAADRAERKAERDACEERFKALSAEIQAVRSEYSGEMVTALRESSKAMTVSAIAQQEGTRVLDRVCRRLEGLPCARDARERQSLHEATPQATEHIPERNRT